MFSILFVLGYTQSEKCIIDFGLFVKTNYKKY